MIRSADNSFAQSARIVKYIPGLLMLSMMVCLPTVFQPIKALLLVIIFGMVGVNILVRKKIGLHWSVVAWTLVLTTYATICMVKGAVNAGPGALRVGTVYVVWPIVFTVLISAVTNETVVRLVVRILILSMLVIAAHTILGVLASLGLFPESLIPSFFERDTDVVIYEGIVANAAPYLSSVFFLIPFLVSALICWPKHMVLCVGRRWLWLTTLLGLAAVLLSTRKALWLATALSPLFTLFFWSRLSRRDRRRGRSMFIMSGMGVIGLTVVAFVVLKYVVGLDVDSFIRFFLSGFDFSGDSGAVLRREQYFALMEGWQDNLLTGAGHGLAASGSIRDHLQPWAYELTYVSMLFHTGLVGVMLFSLWIVWMLWRLTTVVRKGGELAYYALSSSVGLISFLMGNATNPYLDKFDYMWVIYVPMAIINMDLLDEGRQQSAAHACVAS